MNGKRFDVIIVGQGLAGTVLAWTLMHRNQRVLVIDEGRAGTASRIAAGLMTPITGPRLVISWNWEAFWPAAVKFYREVEQVLEASLFQQRPAVRLFANEREREIFERRLQEPAFHRLVRQPEQLVNADWFQNAYSGFEMVEAAQLDCKTFLDKSRKEFHRRECLITAKIDPITDCLVKPTGIELPRLNVSAERMVFCQGFTATPNPWFDRLRFKPAKGELLSVRIPGLFETRSIHQGVWLTPQRPDEFLVGSTFAWEEFDDIPSAAARSELENKLGKFLKLPVEVIGQQAAVRPTMEDAKPVAELHPSCQRLGVLNGLGTKGALMAPLLAERLAVLLLGQQLAWFQIANFP